MITTLCLGVIAIGAVAAVVIQNRRARLAELRLERAQRRANGTEMDLTCWYNVETSGRGVMVVRRTICGTAPVWGVDTTGMGASDRAYAIRCAEEVADKLNERLY